MMISRPVRTSITRLMDILANQTMAAMMAMVISVLRNRRRRANVMMIVRQNRRRVANVVIRRRRRGITDAMCNICDVRYRGRKC